MLRTVAELERVFSEARQKLGPITILVTSAGIESFDAVADITPEKWDRLLAVNLTGTFTCMQLAVPDMTAEGWGRIVTISSSSAQSGAPHMAHYVVSKGGVIGLTKAFAREFASQGITVNTIPPTIVDTPMARNAGRSRERAQHRGHGQHGPERVGPGHRMTSLPRAPSCARTRPATSRDNSSGSTGACTSEPVHGEAVNQDPLAGTTRSTMYAVTTLAMQALLEPLSSQVWP